MLILVIEMVPIMRTISFFFHIFCIIFAKRLIMKYNIRDIFEYTFMLINLFARKFDLTEAQAYRYLKANNGISFIEEHYGILHTLDFPEVIDGLSQYCKKSGGLL